MPHAAQPTRYLPTFLFWNGALVRDVALEVDAAGNLLGTVPADQAPDAIVLRDQALLPGLVNGHSHAFQRLIRGRTEFVAAGREADDFWSWRELMYRVAGSLTPEGLYVASRQAFVEMALAGITAVGEFHYLHRQPDGQPYDDPDTLAHQVIRAAREVGLRITLLRVGYARAGFQAPENPRQKRFIDPDVDTFLRSVEALRASTRNDPAVTIGAAPHSVRAVPRSWLEAVAAARPGQVHMHVSEQPAEIDACSREHERRPVELISEAGLLGPGFTAVHAIHLSQGEIRLLGSTGSTVCACPSTERNLGDGVVPADALLEAGAGLCLGSDSNAHIDLLEEARQLESHLRLTRLRRAVLDPGGGTAEGLGRRLLEVASAGGARSLGLPDGGLRPGAPADFFTVDLTHPSLVGADEATLLPAIMFGANTAAVRNVHVAGKAIVEDGRHPLAEQSARAFGALVKEVFA